MSLLYADGFDGATVGSGGGTSYLSGASYGGAATADGVLGRGGAGVALDNVSGATTRTVSSIASGTGIVVGMAVKPDAGSGLILAFQLSNGSGVQLSLYLDLTNLCVKLYRGTSGGTLLLTGPNGQWTAGEYLYLEMKVEVHDTAGYAEVRIGGSVQAVLTEGDTQNQATGTVTLIGFYCPNCVIDEFYALDDAGDAPLNDFLGDGGFTFDASGADLGFEERAGVVTRATLAVNGGTAVIAQGLHRR